MTVDWNSGISLEENDLRVHRLLSQVDSLTEQTTSMVGVQQFLMSHTKEITSSESVVYIKAKDAETLAKIEKKLTDYIAEKHPKALVTFQVSGNIFNMIFAEQGSPLVVQLHSKGGEAPTVEQVTGLVGKIRKALPDVVVPPAVMEQNIRYIADVEAMAVYDITYDDIYGKMKISSARTHYFASTKAVIQCPSQRAIHVPRHPTSYRARCAISMVWRYRSQW